MRSMTGFGKATEATDKRELSIEIKSVNHRFLDLNIKTPKAFSSYEDVIRKNISAQILRGHIDLYISYVDKSEGMKTVDVDLSLAKEYLNAAKQLETEFHLKNDFNVISLIKSPDVLKVTINDDETESWEALLVSTLKNACKDLNAMRTSEGLQLAKDLKGKIDGIEKLAKQLAGLSKKVIAEYSEKLKVRIKEALESIPLDEARFYNEVAYFVDKSNIDEEITRLNSHIKQFKELLSSEAAVGKQLDFLVQELNREANTICSKSSNTELTQIGLAMKNEIEKIREQIQNVE